MAADVRAPGAPPARRLVLSLLAVCSFTVVFNNLIISPVLKDIASEFDIGVGMAGMLITIYALTAGLVAFFAGPLIDRYGRRRIIVIGITVLTAATFASATAPHFGVLLAFRALAGLGVAGLQPAVFAAVGDYFPYQERGRAMGWVITANTVASVAGVPVGALVAQALSWRLTFVLLGVISGAVALVILARFPRTEPGIATARSDYRANYVAIFRNRFAVTLLLANLLGQMFWFAWITYMGAFFQDEYGLSTGQLAPVMSTIGLGVLIGSNAGGRLADRIGKKPVIVVGGLLSAALIVLQTNLIVTVWLGALLNLIYAIPFGARFTSANALMTELLPERRGALMALNSSALQLGIMSGAAAGGLAVTAGGYVAVGLLASAVILISTLLVMRFIDEDLAVVPQPAPVGA